MITIKPGTRMVGLQLPIQAQSSYFVAPWETEAGPVELARIAKVCDEGGFGYLGVCDHVAIPEAAAKSMGAFWMDPISTLAWLAAHTERIALLTHVFVLAYRHPAMAAKQFATIDHLSGGRLVAGIGAGHVEAEFELLDVDFASRGALLDESLPKMLHTLENEVVDGFAASPRPTQSPRPPIWVAGSSKPGVRRAAQFGDGWLPQSPASRELVDGLLAQLDRFDRYAESFVIGHIAPPIFVGTPSWDVGKYTAWGSPDAIASKVLAGLPDEVNQIQVRVVARDVEECCDQLAAVADSVMPLLTEK